MYRDGLTIDEAIAHRLAAPPEPLPDLPDVAAFARVEPPVRPKNPSGNS